MIIPLMVAALLGSVAVTMTILGARVTPKDPLAAGAVGALAGMGGLIPLLRSHRRDTVGRFQLGMAGTVLHMIVAIALSVGLMATGLINGHGAFGFWLIGGYWVSLLTLIWQLRRLIVGAAVMQV